MAKMRTDSEKIWEFREISKEKSKNSEVWQIGWQHDILELDSLGFS